MATAILAIVFITGVIFFGSRAARKPVSQTANIAAPNTPSGAPDDVSKFEGREAPDFTLTTLDGKNVKLSDLRGKAVVVNFWATWCGPCKIEIPWLMDLQDKYRGQGLQIVGVSMDDGKDPVEKFVQQMKINYTVVMGKEAVGDAYGGVDGLPTTFYIDRAGKIVHANAGLLSKSEIEGNIKSALGQS